MNATHGHDPLSPMPDRRTLESAVALACRAPSLHNSQPWRWIRTSDELRLFSDTDRILPATDPSGRQMVISCGAALHHLQSALAAQSWASVIERMPHRPDPRPLAILHFRCSTDISAHDLRIAAALHRRRTERLPMAPPPAWQATLASLQRSAERFGVHLDGIDEQARPALDDLSRRISDLRHDDPAYQSELNWWASHASYPEGIPADVLPVRGQAVATEREFPSGRARGDSGEHDDAAIVLLSTATDTRLDWLRCGEALSAVLLACTDHGLATCPVTHVTESADARAFLCERIRPGAHPQVLVRVGVRAPSPSATETPRRPLSEVLFREHLQAGDEARS